MDWSEALQTYFPEALTGTNVTRSVNSLLEEEGFERPRTLFGTSTCPDELNRTVTHLARYWGPAFHLGGLAGLPFTGQSGFDAFASHIPDGGNALILYGSHVGITPEGEIGRVIRQGQSQTTLSCGSAVGGYLHLQKEGSSEDVEGQQKYVTELIERNLDDIENSDQPMARLPDIVYTELNAQIKQLIPDDFEHKIALVGGIQINTPEDEEDYFVVKDFSIRLPAEKQQVSLRSELYH